MDVIRPTFVPTLPRSLYLETTNRCDSACQTCIRTFRRLEPPKDLTPAELTQVVEQFPVLERVVLHGIGEPLLNRELFAMISRLKATGATVHFNSNAIGLTLQHAIQLIESGLDEYRVSMDAATSTTYRRIRGVDRFDRVVGNVQGLIDLQYWLKQKSPRVSLWFTATKANLEELPAFVRLAHELGIPEVYVQRLVVCGQGLAVEAESLHGLLRQREEALIQEAADLAAMLEIAFKASGATTPLVSLTGASQATRPWAGCQRPWIVSYITANGNVLPCCISPFTAKDYDNLILGNVFTEEFGSIWNGPRYQAFRAAFETDLPPDPCRGCGLNWSL